MNEEPMTAYLDNYFANFTAIERKLVISAVDVNTGLYKTFTENVGLKDLGTVIRASTSIPFMFEPTLFNGTLYMDGGTAWNINLKDAVDRCLEIVDDESHVVLDIAITEAVSLKKWDKTGKPITNFWRSHEIKQFYKRMNDVVEFAKSRPKVNYRHFFKPDKKFGGWWSELKFDNSTTWQF
jgi:predicted patatin/cPLA2 family phospholipase